MSPRTDTSEALKALDGFALDFLALCYEYERYFPGLLDIDETREVLDEQLPARIASVRACLDVAGDNGAPLTTFLPQHLDATRENLLAAIDIEEAAQVLSESADGLFHWLRRYDCVAAEAVAVAVVARHGRRVVLTRRAHPPAEGHWGLPTVQQVIGQSIEDAARLAAASAGITPGQLSPIITTSYDYLPDIEQLRLTAVVLCDCDAAPTRDDVILADWDNLPAELDPATASLAASGFDPRPV